MHDESCVGVVVHSTLFVILIVARRCSSKSFDKKTCNIWGWNRETNPTIAPIIIETVLGFLTLRKALQYLGSISES